MLQPYKTWHRCGARKRAIVCSLHNPSPSTPHLPTSKFTKLSIGLCGFRAERTSYSWLERGRPRITVSILVSGRGLDGLGAGAGCTLSAAGRISINISFWGLFVLFCSTLQDLCNGRRRVTRARRARGTAEQGRWVRSWFGCRPAATPPPRRCSCIRGSLCVTLQGAPMVRGMPA